MQDRNGNAFDGAFSPAAAALLRAGGTPMDEYPNDPNWASGDKTNPLRRLTAYPMRIGVLEDDAALADHVMTTLQSAGHVVQCFADGKALLARLKRETFDMLILDWNVPEVAGIDVLRWARAHLDGPMPILFLTSRVDEGDIVQALDAGADDYVAKPVRGGELIARVNALLRRSYPAPAKDIERFDNHVFDHRSGSVSIGGEQVALTPKEFELGLLLFRNLDRAMSRSYMMDAVWGHDPDLLTRTLDVHVSRVREKLRLRPALGYKLVPVYSYGYRLEKIDPAAGETW
ncbi:response regulator transcription factor [Sphingomonas sp.]|uniref:response regulator transcription factor n=1 Tax=Sphingomonas sp. TaxID=28214 RepID=UPI0025E21BD9|nr:response regulator transcription factor [Sphingomonas sp.]